MPDLPRAVVVTADQPAVQDQAAAHPGADGQRDQRIGTAAGPERPLPQRQGIHVVVDEHGVAGPLLDERRERHVTQLGEPGERHRAHESLLDVDQARKAHADPGHREPAVRGRGQGAIDQREDRLHHRAAALGGRLGGGEDDAVGADEPRRDRRGSDVDSDDRIGRDHAASLSQAVCQRGNPLIMAARRVPGARRPCGTRPAARQEPVGAGVPARKVTWRCGRPSVQGRDAPRPRGGVPAISLPSALARAWSRGARSACVANVAKSSAGGSPLSDSPQRRLASPGATIWNFAGADGARRLLTTGRRRRCPIETSRPSEQEDRSCVASYPRS